MSDISGTPAQIEATFVLSTYGLTMLYVQKFERVLAAVTLALDAKPWQKRSFKSPEHTRRHLRGLFTRCIHHFQKASASELRKMLPPELDPDLAAEIDALIKWRDRLAHRYLIEKGVLGDGELRFKPGVLAELLRVSGQFDATGKKLNDLLASTITSWPRDEIMSPDAVEVFVSIVRPLMFGEPWQPPQ